MFAEIDRRPEAEEEDDSRAAGVDGEFAREMDPDRQIAAGEKQRRHPCSVGVVLWG